MTFLTDFFTSTQMTALLAAIAVFFTTIILVIKQWVGFAFSSILLLISIIIAGLIHQPQFFNRAEPFAFVEKNQEQFAELQKEVILLKEVSANFFKEVQLKIEKVNKKTSLLENQLREIKQNVENQKESFYQLQQKLLQLRKKEKSDVSPPFFIHDKKMH